MSFFSMKRDRRALFMLFCVGFLVLAADQITKELVRHTIDPGEAVPEHGAIRLINQTNPGIIFGIPAPTWFALAMPAIMVTLALAAYFWYGPLHGRLLNAGLGCFLGGTIGNWIDRLRFPGVTDFIDVRLRGNIHWFTFNLADMAILAAILMLAIVVLRLRPTGPPRKE